MKYYGYVRVSTYEQGLKGVSLEVQEKFLKNRAQTLGANFILQREVESGKDLEGRPILTKLIKTLEEGDILGTYDESRLSRNTSDSIRIATALAGKGAILEIGGKTVNVEDPTSELGYVINSAIAQYQRKIQNAKAKASMQLKRDCGDYVVSGALYGYDLKRKRGKTTATINQDEAKVIKYIYDAFIKGKTISTISRVTNLRIGRVRAILLNPFYIGKYMSEPVDRFVHPEQVTEDLLIKSNIYPPIIDEDIYWKVNRLYQKNHKPKDYSYRKSIHLLTGVYHGACCNCGLMYVSVASGRNYYATTHHSVNCTLKARYCVREKDLEHISKAIMLTTLKSGIEVAEFYAEQRNLLYGTIEETREKILDKEKELKTNQTKINRLIDLAAESDIEVELFKEKINKLKKEESDIKNELTSLRITVRAQEGSIEELIESENEESIDEFLTGDNEMKRNFYLRHIKSAVIYEDRIEVLFSNLKKFIVQRKKTRSPKETILPFEMQFKGKKQAKGEINLTDGTIKFKFSKAKDEFDKYVNEYYSKVAEEVNEIIKTTT